ncbi:unnamed protein product [Nezara viridula]|uniref:Uncharacterized protein n=1 Tax=Nezara viridula TaxID=85310 RepID=A0A9P0HC29_NEZVI|nr:unnamed protein product [Nezara viridula]
MCDSVYRKITEAYEHFDLNTEKTIIKGFKLCFIDLVKNQINRLRNERSDWRSGLDECAQRRILCNENSAAMTDELQGVGDNYGGGTNYFTEMIGFSWANTTILILFTIGGIILAGTCYSPSLCDCLPSFFVSSASNRNVPF